MGPSHLVHVGEPVAHCSSPEYKVPDMGSVAGLDQQVEVRRGLVGKGIAEQSDANGAAIRARRGYDTGPTAACENGNE